MEIEDKELTKEQQRKLKSIAKSINALVTDIRKTYPNAAIYTLDLGGLYVFEQHACDKSLDSVEPLARVTDCSIFGGAF